MGQMNRAIAREEEDGRKRDRFASTLVIAASIIAAVRLAQSRNAACVLDALCRSLSDAPTMRIGYSDDLYQQIGFGLLAC